MLTGRKPWLTLAFTAFVALSTGLSCQGFFQSPTLTSLTINPATPSVLLGGTDTLSAYAVNSNNQGKNLTNGVSWSSSSPSIANFTGTCLTGPCGNATVQGLAIGTSTITASSENVTNTTTLTVYITVSSMTVTPTSQSIANLTDTTPLPYVVTVEPGSVDISSSAVLTPSQNGTATSDITCSYDTSNPNGGSGGAGIYCTGNGSEATGTYQLTATYTGTNITATAMLDVQ